LRPDFLQRYGIASLLG